MAEADIDSVETTGTFHAPENKQPDPAPIEPVAAAPTVETKPVIEGQEPEAAVDADPKAAPRVNNPFQTRIDKLTREKHDALREKAALELKVAQYEQAQARPQEGQATEVPPAPRSAQQPDVDTLVNQRAQQLYQQRVQQERVNSVLSAGNSEYKDFTDRCNTVASLGAADRPDFMEMVTDPSIVPDGHKIIASLADDPNEAARIFSLPTVAMSAELARYAEKVGKVVPKQPAISKAPTPIKPLAGSATASDEPSSTDSEDVWFAKREAQRAARQQGARF